MANLMESLKELNRLKQSAKTLEKQLRAEKMPFSSRDGRIKGVISGKLEILSLEIDPELVSEKGKNQLEKLLVSAFNGAVEQMQARVSRLVGSQMGLNLPGM